ncbi:hypothetical protein Esti_003546 [Eimeria stiedai]
MMGSTEPLTDGEREQLRQRLLQRRQELQQQQQQVKQLQGRVSQVVREGLLAPGAHSAAVPAGEDADVGKSVASLLNEVMASMKAMQAAAASRADAAQEGRGGRDTQAPLGKTAAAAAQAPSVSAATFARQGGFPERALRGQASLRLWMRDHRQRGLGFKAGVTTLDRGVQACLESPDHSEDEAAEEEHEAEGSLAAAYTLKKSLTARLTSPLLPAAEVAGTPALAEAHAALPSQLKFHLVSEAERKRVMATPEFQGFFSSSTKLVERLLGESEVFSAFVDYSGAEAEAHEGSEELLTFVDVYRDSRYAPHRPITDLRASPAFPELFLAAYGSPSSRVVTPADADGCVLVWSLALKQRPEYVFTCQSAVCSALFDKFQPYVIVGGTYGGSLVLWDSRAQASPKLSLLSVTPPVYSLEMVGTKNAHNLVSIDTDGRLCQWSLQMMGHPAETLDLKRGSRDVCVECMSFPEGEVNVLCLGAEDGSLMTANIHGNKVGIMEFHEAHGGALTSLHFHPGPSEGWRDYSHLLLSSSVDWSVKLWSNKNLESPIVSFDADAYVYDAKWHPTSPAVFASTDGGGSLQVWNLAADWAVSVEVAASLHLFALQQQQQPLLLLLLLSMRPQAALTFSEERQTCRDAPAAVAACAFALVLLLLTLFVERRFPVHAQVPVFSSSKTEAAAGSLLAKNKVAWSTDGRRLATGDALGNIEMWNLSTQVMHAAAVSLIKSSCRLS